jgi:hypothetical protein
MYKFKKACRRLRQVHGPAQLTMRLSPAYNFLKVLELSESFFGVESSSKDRVGVRLRVEVRQDLFAIFLLVKQLEWCGNGSFQYIHKRGEYETPSLG